MSDSTIVLSPGNGDLLLDSEQLTVGSNIVKRQRIQVAGVNPSEIGAVRNAAPVLTDYGQVVRIPGPTGQDHGVVQTPEIGVYYVAGRARASLLTGVVSATITAATGQQLIAGVANKFTYLLWLSLHSTVISSLFVRNGASAAGALRGIWRLNALAHVSVPHPPGGFLVQSDLGSGLWINASDDSVMNITYGYIQV
jgi:hypothetical protein